MDARRLPGAESSTRPRIHTGRNYMTKVARATARFAVSLSAAVVSFASAPASAAPVVGSHDSASNKPCRVTGWAKDPGTTQAIWVDFYRDGPYGSGVHIGGAQANLARPDLPFADKNHGFTVDFPLSSGLFDGNTHTIHAYGVALAAGSTSALLGLSPKSVTCAVKVNALPGADDDQTAAIQSAIAAAGENGVVFFPDRTYLLETASATVGVYPDPPNGTGGGIPTAIHVNVAGLTLLGQSVGGVVLKLKQNTRMRILSASAVPPAVGGGNLTIRNIVFDGNKLNRRVTLPGQPGSGYGYGDVVDALVYGNHVTGFSAYNVESRNGIEDGIGCWMCSNVVVQQSNFHNNGVPLAGGMGIAFTGNIADFSNNTISNNSHGIWAAYGASNVTISSNTITNNAGAGIEIGGQGGMDQGFTITNNTITGNGSAGYAAIGVHSANSGTINGNIVTDNKDGIKLDGSSAAWALLNNTITSNSGAPIHQEHGIWLLNNVASVHLTGNYTKGNGTSLNNQIQVVNAASVTTPNWASLNTMIYP